MPELVRGLVRAGLVLILGAAGALIWRALISSGTSANPAGKNLPPVLQQRLRQIPSGWSLVYNEPVSRLVNDRLGNTLGVLALAMLLGVVAGFGAAGLSVVIGRVAGLVGLLWSAPVPAALTVLTVAALSGARHALLTLAFALGGVVAIMIARGAGERWRRRKWAAGAVAGLAAAGQGLAVATAALVVGEALTNRPGVGSLVVQGLAHSDGHVVLGAMTVLLAIALGGQAAGALAGALADYLDPGAPAPERSTASLLLLVTLAIPVLVVAGSLLAGGTNAYNAAHAMAAPSMSHPLGTDLLGRDVLARFLVGYRHTLLLTVGGVLLATVLAAAWAALAVFVARQVRNAGDAIAEVILGPGRLVTMAPLLLAGVVLLGVDRWWTVLALALVFTPRLAVAIADLARPLPTAAPDALRGAAGLLLTTCGVALAVLTGLQTVGLATKPPDPDIGSVLSQSIQQPGTSQAVAAALVTVVAIAPFLLSGWALLRHPRQAEAVAAVTT